MDRTSHKEHFALFLNCPHVLFIIVLVYYVDSFFDLTEDEVAMAVICLEISQSLFKVRIC